MNLTDDLRLLKIEILDLIANFLIFVKDGEL